MSLPGAPLTRRLAHGLSYVTLSTSASGQLTLPLVDPATGRLEHYALVKISSPTLALRTTSGSTKCIRSSRRTLSDTGLLASLDKAGHIAGLTDSQRRLTRLSEEYFLDVPLSALFACSSESNVESIALAFEAKLSRSESASSSALSLPPSPLLKSRHMRLRALIGSREGTPELLETSQRSSLFSSPSLSLARTPARSAARTSCPGASDSGIERKTAAEAADTSAALVGLGLLGMTNTDGSPFDGLGVLPHTPFYDEYEHTAAHATSTPLSGSAADFAFLSAGRSASHAGWHWAGALRWEEEEPHFADAPLSPGARYWRDATAADFRRRLDDALRGASADEVRAVGTLKMARHRERRSKMAHERYGLPCAPAVDDVFLSAGSASAVRSDASTPVGPRTALGFCLLDATR